MNRTYPTLLIIVLVLVLTPVISAAATCSIDAPQTGKSLWGRNAAVLTGTLLPIHDMDNPAVQGRDKLVVKVDGKEWLFLVKEVVPVRPEVTASDIMNRMVFNDLKIEGDRSLTAPLGDPGLTGRTVRLEGLLYTDIGRMVVGHIDVLC